MCMRALSLVKCTEKTRNRNCYVCTRALPLVKCTRPLTDSILLSRLTLSLSIPPSLSPLSPPPPPFSRVHPVLPLFSLFYPFSICQTNSSATPPPPLPPPLPTPSTPHDPPSRLHTAWRYPSSTIRLNLVNHSQGRSKHHK